MKDKNPDKDKMGGIIVIFKNIPVVWHVALFLFLFRDTFIRPAAGEKEMIFLMD